MFLNRKAASIVFALLGVLIWYSAIMGITSMGFILDGYMTWKEPNKAIAIAEFCLAVGVFSLAIYTIRHLGKTKGG